MFDQRCLVKAMQQFIRDFHHQFHVNYNNLRTIGLIFALAAHTTFVTSLYTDV